MKGHVREKRIQSNSKHSVKGSRKYFLVYLQVQKSFILLDTRTLRTGSKMSTNRMNGDLLLIDLRVGLNPTENDN